MRKFREDSLADRSIQEMDSSRTEYLGALFRSQFNKLYHYGLKLVGHSELVKDTIQDIFADLLNRENQLAPISNINAYLYVSLRRSLLRNVQKLRNTENADEQTPDGFCFSSEDFLIHQELGSEFRQLMANSLTKLTERQREVIFLRFKNELDFDEIASVMDMKVQSVRNLLFRALEQIRNDLDGRKIIPSLDAEIFLKLFFAKKS
ncbi:RNA polymerase sigma factor [Mangrovibacterium marinum]|nr:sigma-70 family RNA polymerase sigma factor [Mangrovibacterium marinum]